MSSGIEVYAEQVRRDTSRIMARVMEKFGPHHEVSQILCDLNSHAANLVSGAQMAEERAGEYDLAALHVAADVASNSETGWEREE